MSPIGPPFSLFLAFLATAGAAYALTEVSGSVQGDWGLDGSPYVATETIYVAPGASLTIDPGVEVRFNESTGFLIYGELIAGGDEGDSILFAPVAGAQVWQGLRFLQADSTSLLDYCIVRMGHAAGEGDDSTSLGGNLLISRSNIILSRSRMSSGQAAHGGGVAIMGCAPKIVECLISDNRSGLSGGGIHIGGESNPELTGCILIHNEAGSAGGGIYFTDNSRPLLSHCTFIGNSAGATGGAVSIHSGASPSFSRCELSANNAPAGAGAYVRDSTSTPLFDWCRFYANATNAGDRVGGGIYIRGEAAPEIRYTMFIENDATYGGGIYAKEPPRSNIHHCLFLRNGALRAGGGVATSTDLGDTPLTIVNCTFVNNRGTGVESVATAAYARPGSLILINSSIVWGSGPLFGEAGRVYVAYSNVQGGFPGDGNSFANPKFFPLDSTLFLLAGDSPCVDSSDTTLSAEPDGTVRDRGWMRFPKEIWTGLASDTLYAELTIPDRATEKVVLRNNTEVPVYVTPMDNWRPSAAIESADVSAVTGDLEIHGAALTKDGIALCGGNNGQNPNKIYIINRGLDLENAFDQPGNDDDGFTDLATDGGSVIYGGGGRFIFELTTDGEEGDLYDNDFGIANIRGLAADPKFPYHFLDFYLGGDEGYIVRADDEMWERGRIQIGDSIRSIGVKQNTRALYLATETPDSMVLLSLVTPDDGKIQPLYYLAKPDSAHLGGIEVTQDWQEGRGSLVGIWERDGAGDLLFVDDLYTSWLILQPEWKLMMPGDEAQWDVTFAGDQMSAGEYLDHFFLPVNGYGEGSEVYASLDLRPMSAPHATIPPASFAISRIYPNPFNARTRVEFRLPNSGFVQLHLTDIAGRQVMSLPGAFGLSGMNEMMLDLGRVPSGTYLLGLSLNRRVSTAPITIIK